MARSDAQEQLMAELRQERSQLEALVTHPGWQVLDRAVQGQIMSRRQAMFNQELRGLDDCFALARHKAEVSGMQLAIALPSIMLTDLDASIKALLEQMREGTEDERHE